MYTAHIHIREFVVYAIIINIIGKTDNHLWIE